jgi:hypothetical protein
VKLHRSYSVPELAACLAVHKNTIRNWQGEGLEPVDSSRPVLFDGASIRAFLLRRNKARKRPCPPGTLYCLRCREPRAPALGMVDYVPMTPDNGNLRALCGYCEGVMHRRARRADVDRIMPGCTVQMAQRPTSIFGRREPSLNCDLDKER